MGAPKPEEPTGVTTARMTGGSPPAKPPVVEVPSGSDIPAPDPAKFVLYDHLKSAYTVQKALTEFQLSPLSDRDEARKALLEVLDSHRESLGPLKEELLDYCQQALEKKQQEAEAAASSNPLRPQILPRQTTHVPQEVASESPSI